MFKEVVTLGVIVYLNRHDSYYQKLRYILYEAKLLVYKNSCGLVAVQVLMVFNFVSSVLSPVQHR